MTGETGQRAGQRQRPPRAGLVIVDKPAGMTSHDVVARVRRIAGTRKVGHAGTLDPMATGVLVVGVERATKLLGWLTGHDKTYAATIRLGAATTTDDVEGEVVTVADPSAIGALTDDGVRAGLAALTGSYDQVPAAVSAVKVAGRRAYARVRAGEAVELPARPVTVHTIDVAELRRGDRTLEVDVTVTCSAGTYVRAIARDLGAALGVGGHLSALRRTRSGDFGLVDAVTLDALADADQPVPLDLDTVVRRCFAVHTVTGEDADRLAHGIRLAGVGQPGTYAVAGPNGVVALVEEVDGRMRPAVVLRPAD